MLGKYLTYAPRDRDSLLPWGGHQLELDINATGASSPLSSSIFALFFGYVTLRRILAPKMVCVHGAASCSLRVEPFYIRHREIDFFTHGSKTSGKLVSDILLYIPARLVYECENNARVCVCKSSSSLVRTSPRPPSLPRNFELYVSVFCVCFSYIRFCTTKLQGGSTNKYGRDAISC